MGGNLSKFDHAIRFCQFQVLILCSLTVLFWLIQYISISTKYWLKRVTVTHFIASSLFASTKETETLEGGGDAGRLWQDREQFRAINCHSPRPSSRRPAGLRAAGSAVCLSHS